jgi:hypothetical protein
MQKMICFYDSIDTAFEILEVQFMSMKNERLKSYLARDIRKSKNPAAIPALIKLANDTCEYVRLEVGRSLARLGEKDVSYKLLYQIWQMGIYPINVDRFHYFTSGMRNINTPESVDFLINLAGDTNPYCALDASICLMQIGERDEGLKVIRGLIATDDPAIFKALSRALYKYYPTTVLTNLFQSMGNPKNMEIARFRECVLNKYGGE